MAAAAEKIQDESEQSKDSAEQAPEKGKFDFLGAIIFLLLCINLATVGAMGYFLNNLWQQFQHLKQETEEIRIATKSEEKAALGEELKPAELGILYPIESFLVNISSDQGPKFLQAQIELELFEPALENEIARKKPALRDAIIVLLSSRSYRELRDPAGMQKLRGDILRAINNILRTGKIKNVYFTQFHFN